MCNYQNIWDTLGAFDKKQIIERNINIEHPFLYKKLAADGVPSN